MPIQKTCYAKLAGVDESAFQGLAARLKKVAFGLNSNLQVIGLDAKQPRLSVEVALRKAKTGLEFDETSGRFLESKGYDYRRLNFELNLGSGIVSTPGAARDFAILAALLKLAGAPGAETHEMVTDIKAWVTDLARMYDKVQLANLVIDNYLAEPKRLLLGRFSAKSIDNRLDQSFLEPDSGSLRSIRFSFFYEGMRRSIEARANAAMSLTSSEEEDLDHFHSEQEQLLLKHSEMPGQ